ncbi:nuclear receptor subfamily 1 group I member 3 isoform X1 [Pleurodeles waltl]|uniref:nuclear receptor subfamily 1 group I member 3 isoform X1 n=1 Tax=Pleurodeles waltl TaxID=8319 RepID=UPI0037095CCB
MQAMYRASDEDSFSSSNLSTSPSSCQASENEDTDPEGEDKLCTVCGDKATGYHFHVMSCEGCKGFFRRSVSKGVNFTCQFTRSCTINKTKRRQCQACRLQKCLDAGMRKEMIMSHESLMIRRALRNQRKQERLQRMEQETPDGLTEEQEQLIEILKHSHKKNFSDSMPLIFGLKPPDRLYTCFKKSRDKCCWNPSSLSLSSCSLSPTTEGSLSPLYETPSEEQRETLIEDHNCSFEAALLLQHFSDLHTFVIEQLIKFAKEIPDFRELSMDDQIALLKGAAFEVSQIQCNTLFNEDTLSWDCGEICYSIEDCLLVGTRQMFLDLAIKFSVNLKKLKLHEAEYVLMEAIALFAPDRPGVFHRDVIDQIHEKMALTLQCYIQQRHPGPEGRFLYAKILCLLAELRTLNVENTKEILLMQERSANFVSPLIKELVS